jgi:hypothetical protein
MGRSIRRIFLAPILVGSIASLLASAGPAAAENDEATDQSALACRVGHRFSPGPIVNGHNRQPTPREFQARVQELTEWEQKSGAVCRAPSARDEAIIQVPLTDLSRDQIAKDY